MIVHTVLRVFKRNCIQAYFYRPQRGWGKVIFSEACVKNSVYRRVGGGAGLQAHTQGEVEGSGGSQGPHLDGGLQAHTRGV